MLAFNGSQALTARHLNGPNTGAYDQYFTTLAEDDLSAGVTFDLPDELGTVRDIVNSSGQPVDHLNYNAYGVQVYASAPSVTHIDGYAGGFYDPSTNLLYYIDRWYDPTATVWIQADPSGFTAGDTDLTRYVGNDPTNETDPTGLAPPEPNVLWPWDPRASWNPLATAKLWGSMIAADAVRADQFVGQLNTAAWTGNWVDSDATSGVGAASAAAAGVGRGAKNIVVGTAKGVREMGYVGADFANAYVESCTAGRFAIYQGDLSQAMQALNSGDVGLGQYYGDTGANAVTWGTYGQGKTLYQLGTGQITVDQASEQIGSTAVFQLVAAKLISMSKVAPEQGTAAATGESCPSSAAHTIAERFPSVGAARPDTPILQRGGKTILRSTAKALNDALERNLHARDWGRALESLKRAEGLRNDHHGVIDAAGNYWDDVGNLLGNLEDFLP